MYLHFPIGWVLFQKFAIICEPAEFLRFDVIECKRQGHFTMPVMVAICFAICRDVSQFRDGPVIGQRGQQPRGKSFPIVQQLFKCDRLRNGSIVEEQMDGLACRRVQEISTSGIDL